MPTKRSFLGIISLVILAVMLGALYLFGVASRTSSSGLQRVGASLALGAEKEQPSTAGRAGIGTPEAAVATPDQKPSVAPRSEGENARRNTRPLVIPQMTWTSPHLPLLVAAQGGRVRVDYSGIPVPATFQAQLSGAAVFSDGRQSLTVSIVAPDGSYALDLMPAPRAARGDGFTLVVQLVGQRLEAAGSVAHQLYLPLVLNASSVDSITPIPVTTTATPSPTGTAGASVTPSITPTWTGTATPTATGGATPSATPTASPTGAQTPTPSVTPTASPTGTQTPPSTATPTDTPTATPISSHTPTATPIATHTSTATPSATPSATSTPTPTATTPAGDGGIYGQVTYNGAAAAGIQLSLRFSNGFSESTAATTTTAADGSYRFTGVGPLGGGQKYFVRFGRNESNANYLSLWDAAPITSYSGANAVFGGDFDIADVKLLSPADGATQAVPVTFRWQRRAISTETYRWVLLDPENYDLWPSDDLGYAESYNLQSLPEGAVSGRLYNWSVWVFGSAGGMGWSFGENSITF